MLDTLHTIQEVKGPGPRFRPAVYYAALGAV